MSLINVSFQNPTRGFLLLGTSLGVFPDLFIYLLLHLFVIFVFVHTGILQHR